MNNKNRRCKTLISCWDTYIFIVLSATFFHLYFILDLPEGIKYINMTIGISYLLIIYLGYKFGRWLGLIGAILSTVSWLVYVLLDNYETTTFELLVKGSLKIQDDVILTHISINHISLYALLGYFSGVLFDILEDFLNKKSSTLNEILPFSNDLFINHID